LNGQRKMLEFVFYLVLFLICIGLLIYNGMKPPNTTPPPPMPDQSIFQSPAPIVTPMPTATATLNVAPTPTLLPQNIPYWELD